MDEQQKSREAILYRGGPSQYVNFNTFTICGIVLVISMLAPILWKLVPAEHLDKKTYFMLLFKLLFFWSISYAFWSWLKIRCHRYVVSNERLSESVGVFNRFTEELELYRVKDITFVQPFNLRMFGLGNIVLDTSDKSTPIVVLYAVKGGQELLDKIRINVEKMRTLKGVREID